MRQVIHNRDGLEVDHVETYYDEDPYCSIKDDLTTLRDVSNLIVVVRDKLNLET